MMKSKNSCQNKKPMIGISIYPHKATKQKIISYCKLAKEHGFNRIFTNLIGLTKDEINKFIEICNEIKFLNLKVIVDVDQTVLDILDIKLTEIKKWKELNVDGIRLDVKFDGQKVSDLSNNDENFQIEINASDFSGIENEIVKFPYNEKNIVASHNFFPQKFTGLSIEKFLRSSLNMKEKGFRVSAFVSKIETSKTISSWKESENSSTLEIGREMSVIDEIRYLMKFDFLDYIIVSNMYLNEEEFLKIKQLDNKVLSFNIFLNNNISKEEKSIVKFKEHKLRGDNPDHYFLRSTISRKVFKYKIDSKGRDNLLYPGQVVICSSKLGRYSNELHIIKKEIVNNDYKKNVVGIIDKNQLPLLDITCPNLIFNFNIKNNFERKKNEK